MISTDMSNTREDLATIEQLVTEFFRSADINKDNYISQEEFVTGVSDMPVILHLLQCDPDIHDLDQGPVNKFDEIKKMEKKKASGSGIGYHSSAYNNDSRRFAYATK